MKRWCMATAILCAAAISASAWAGEGCGKAAAGCGGAKATAAAGGCGGKCADKCGAGGCSGQALRGAGMPVLNYHVGEEKTHCPDQAAELIKKNPDAKVKYALADKEYTNRDEAFGAYEAALNEFLGTITTVRYAVGDKCVACPDAAKQLAKDNGGTVKYRLASFSFEDRAKADEVAKAARQAAEGVKATPAAASEGKSCGGAAKAGCAGAEKAGCAKGEATAAGEKKSCGEKAAGQTVAAGDKKCCAGEKKDCAAAKETVAQASKKGCCPTSEKIDLAKARIQAAYDAIAKASGQEVAGA